MSYPDNNPKTQFGLQKTPIHLVPPSAIIALANSFKIGADKYGPYNWRENKVSASVYYAAMMRHMLAWWDGEDKDEETGNSHLDHAMGCIAIIKDGESLDSLIDDRPFKGAAAALMKTTVE